MAKLTTTLVLLGCASISGMLYVAPEFTTGLIANAILFGGVFEIVHSNMDWDI